MFRSLGAKVYEIGCSPNGLNINNKCGSTNPSKIKLLTKKFGVKIKSLTGDCFMQAPFWKSKNYKRLRLQNDFINIVAVYSANLSIFCACTAWGILFNSFVHPPICSNRLGAKKQFVEQNVFNSAGPGQLLNKYVQIINLLTN